MLLLCLAEAAQPRPGHASAGATVLGVALGLAAGTTYALYTWAAHRLIGRGVSTRAAMGAVFGLGGLLLLPVLLATGAPLVASWANAGVGAYMALVPMFTGYLLFGWALAHVPATTATTLTLLEPAVATLLAVTIVGEHLPAAGWAGLALIAGCLVVLTAPPRLRRPGNERVDLPATGGPRVAGMAGGEFLTIGELARAAGLTAKTVRFWSDQGLLPRPGRTPAGYRLYGPGALARLGLIRALRDLGVGLAGVRKVLDREITIGEVAAVHAAALEVQVRALRLQQAVLRAVASRGITTAEEFQLMHKLANLSAAERRRMVTDFIDDTFAGIDVSPDFLTMMRGAMPDLPGEPTREQIEAWVELAERPAVLAAARDHQRLARPASRHARGRMADRGPAPPLTAGRPARAAGGQRRRFSR